jgi:hypothetical protein
MKLPTWLLIGVTLLGSPLGAQGKPLTVTGVRGLTFGVVLPGVPMTISRTNAASSGQFDISAAKNSPIQLSFTLPSAMTGPAGATMPLVFGGSDAGYSSPETITSQVGFDPKQPFVTTLDKNGRAAVFLGGTAVPAPSQRAGSYTATLTLTVVLLP